MPEQTDWDNTFKRTLGEVLRELRTERRLSQDVLAATSGVSVNHISLVERGLTAPTLLLIFHLAAALEVSPIEIVTRVASRVDDPTSTVHRAD